MDKNTELPTTPTTTSSYPNSMDSTVNDQNTSSTSTDIDSKLTSNSSSMSFNILSRNPSEEYNQKKEEAICVEHNRLEMVNKKSKQTLKEYKKLGEVCSEVKEEIIDMTSKSESNISSQQQLQQNNDIVTNMIRLCDQMCLAFDDPHNVDSTQLKGDILSLTKEVKSRELEYQQHKKWMENLQSQNNNLTQQIQQYIDEREQAFSFSSREDQSTQTHMAGEYHPEKHLKQQVSMEKHCRSSNAQELEELKEKYRELEKEKQTLLNANSQWDVYCKKIQTQSNTKITAMENELAHAEEVIKSLKINIEEIELNIQKVTKKCEEKIQKYEEQRDKVEKFATGQAAKVDDLKLKLKQEHTKNEEVDNINKQLVSVTEIQKEEIDRLKVQIKQLKEALAKHEATQAQGSLDLTLDNRNPRKHPHRSQNVIDNLKTDILVLQQQVKIYKDDFEGERRDREKCHSELSTLRNHFGQIRDDLKSVQEELSRKNREVEALKAARDQDRIRLSKKDDEIRRLNANVNRAVAEQSRLQNQIDRLKRESEYQQPPPYEYISRENSNTQPLSHPVQPQDTSISSHIETLTWTCAYCTFKNHAELDKCQMCDQKAPGRQNTFGQSNAPVLPYGPVHHGDLLYNMAEQCDDGTEWVKPAGLCV